MYKTLSNVTEREDLISYYYSDEDLIYFFTGIWIKREACFLPSKDCNLNIEQRFLNVSSKNSFYFFWDYLNFFRRGRLYNMYYSLLEFKEGIPKTSFKKIHLKERNSLKDHYKENYYLYAIGYDCVIDIDSDEKEFNYSIESAISIRDILTVYKIPYRLRFSGRGFHFIIPHEYLPKYSFDPKQEDNIYKMCYEIGNGFYIKVSEMVDIKIYDGRRVIKMPYSVACYPEGDFVCSPIHPDTLETFKRKDYQIENYRKPFIYEDPLHNAKEKKETVQTNILKLRDVLNE